METEKKKPVFDKRISPEILREMRNKILLMPKGLSYRAISLELMKDYPQFKKKTIGDYVALCHQVCEDVFQLMEQGKISITALLEFKGEWDDATQKYIAKECVENGLKLSMLREIKRLKREHGTMGYTEAIARVKGEIPPEQPRKENKRSLDQLLTQLADLGNRWRAMVTMALELVRQEEGAAGIHEAIFEKAFMLRQIVGEQYDFINNKTQRMINAIRKRLKAAADGIEAKPLDDGVVDVEFKTDAGNHEAPLSGAEEK